MKHTSENLATLCESEYTREDHGAHGGCFTVYLPDGKSFVLTPEQAVAAVIEPHGNFGRSRIRFTLSVEVEARGHAEAYRAELAKALLEKIDTLAKERDSLSARVRELVEKFNTNANSGSGGGRS